MRDLYQPSLASTRVAAKRLLAKQLTAKAKQGYVSATQVVADIYRAGGPPTDAAWVQNHLATAYPQHPHGPRILQRQRSPVT